jgi:hypothetical protein
VQNDIDAGKHLEHTRPQLAVRVADQTDLHWLDPNSEVIVTPRVAD